jgi:nitroimidazol reductase NimA-like FMN-containing flavoprotein (pyridoxamine 5'-phosphate oxidase superfamily)
MARDLAHRRKNQPTDRKFEVDVEITTEMEQFIRRAEVLRLGLAVDNQPYVVPVSFGYLPGKLYFHSRRSSHKLEMLHANPRVCFEMEADVKMVPSDNPCSFTASFRSLIGFGTARIIEQGDEISLALDVIVRHYGGEPGEYATAMLERLAVVEISIDSLTLREHVRK